MTIDYIIKGRGHAIGVKRAEKPVEAPQSPPEPDVVQDATESPEPFWKRRKVDTTVPDAEADASPVDED